MRTRRRLAIRKRHQNKHLDSTLPAFEAEGREFESLRARHLFQWSYFLDYSFLWLPELRRGLPQIALSGDAARNGCAGVR